MDFTLRAFRRDDFEALWRIDQECFPPGISYSRVELALFLRRSGSFTLVAESAASGCGRPGGKEKAPDGAAAIAGFLVAHPGRQGLGHIITIDVLPHVRRAGLGSKLLLAAEARLRLAHCHAVYLETAVDNVSALTFYKRHGYSLVKTILRYYSNGVDAFVLTKEL